MEWSGARPCRPLFTIFKMDACTIKWTRARLQVDDTVGSSKLQQAVVWVRKLHIRALIQVHFRQRDPIFFFNFLQFFVLSGRSTSALNYLARSSFIDNRCAPCVWDRCRTVIIFIDPYYHLLWLYLHLPTFLPVLIARIRRPRSAIGRFWHEFPFVIIPIIIHRTPWAWTLRVCVRIQALRS